MQPNDWPGASAVGAAGVQSPRAALGSVIVTPVIVTLPVLLAVKVYATCCPTVMKLVAVVDFTSAIAGLVSAGTLATLLSSETVVLSAVVPDAEATF